MIEYRRRLPHDCPVGQALFLTWHLHGSLPHALYPPPGKWNSGAAFVWMDRYLDTSRVGPQFLRQEAIAQLVVGSIHYAAEKLGFFEIDAYVVMPNHVHLLVVPKVKASRFLKSVKNYTALEANKLLGRAGQPFWQSESYDHWARNPAERLKIRTYIENNPVKGGLAASPVDYPWSSAKLR